MTIPDDRTQRQIEAQIAAARDSAERSRELFAELQTRLGIAQASQVWWAYFGAYDATET